jgi:hypothetical protein
MARMITDSDQFFISLFISEPIRVIRGKKDRDQRELAV